MSLQKIQAEIKQISTKNGFDDESVEQKFMLLFEEVGEFAKSVRELVGTKVGKHSKKFEASQEASDVMYVLTDICNKLGIDLEKSFNKKLAKIKKRYK
jgi:NTP pyrophosphatase (non-canonical NTP hydrolase)